MNTKKRLIIGVSGATGAIYGVRMLEILSKIGDIETHLVLSKAGKMTIQVETPYSVKEVEAMADVVHDVNNVGASISSGSFRTAGMVIAPCSMKSMGAIAHSLGGDLLVRAADVVLKERKKLVLVVRETPLHLGHLEAMAIADTHGRDHFPAGAGVLPSAKDFGRRDQPDGDADSRSVRHRCRIVSPLGRRRHEPPSRRGQAQADADQRGQRAQGSEEAALVSTAPPDYATPPGQ